jgi:DNA replication and repair protein RecF
MVDPGMPLVCCPNHFILQPMLMLQQISLYQFKNYLEKNFVFNERVVGIYGKNGVGKTNLLDAIHYLCFTRGYFSRQDTQHVKHGCQGFRIEGFFDYNHKIEKATCVFRENGRKEFALNDNYYEKFSRHIGHYPCVVIAPDDAGLITGDSRERRMFIDELISQLNQDYLQQLISYKKILDQRNSLLRSVAEKGGVNFALLDVLDQQLSISGEKIFEERKQFMEMFLPMVKELYTGIALQPDNLQLEYECDLLRTNFNELLKANRQKDCFAQRTTCGIHKDDIDMRYAEQPFKNIASQGQRKSLLFALKLSEVEMLEKEKGFPPLLLLDDVFEKLDEDRITNLLKMVCLANNGQVFITDTTKERLESYLQKLCVSFQLIGI